MPACIHYAATLLPLEIVFRVPKPEPTETDAYAAKKTWRGDRPAQEQEKKEVWTASDIMEGRALDRGFRKSSIGLDPIKLGWSMRVPGLIISDGQGRKTRWKQSCQWE